MQTNTPRTDAETIAALTAKCALLSASLKQAEQTNPRPAFSYAPAAKRIYALTDEADTRALSDVISMRLAQLSAMLHGLCGEGGEAHRRTNDTLQDNYCWACSTMANEIEALFEHMATVAA
jgi:hypothetical protein